MSLHPGDVFPELTVQLTDRRSLVVPEEFYSSGAIGRLVPDDVVGLIRHVRANTAQDTA